MAVNLNPVHTGPGRQITPATTGPGSTEVNSTTALPTYGVLVKIVNIGTGGDMYFEQDFTASSQWHAVHELGVIPNVAVYDATGHEIGADVQVDSSEVTVTWPGPTTGKIVCS